MTLNPVIIQSLIVRVKSLITTLALVSTIIITHLGLIHLSDTWKDFIQLVCLILIGLSNSPVGKFVEPRVDIRRRSDSELSHVPDSH